MSKILNKCPCCSSALVYHELCQYDNVYRITKKGQLSTRRIYKEDEGPLNCGFISCTNCGFCTNCDLEVEEKGGYRYVIFRKGNTFMFDLDEE